MSKSKPSLSSGNQKTLFSFFAKPASEAKSVAATPSAFKPVSGSITPSSSLLSTAPSQSASIQSATTVESQETPGGERSFLPSRKRIIVDDDEDNDGDGAGHGLPKKSGREGFPRPISMPKDEVEWSDDVSLDDSDDSGSERTKSPVKKKSKGTEKVVKAPSSIMRTTAAAIPHPKADTSLEKENSIPLRSKQSNATWGPEKEKTTAAAVIIPDLPEGVCSPGSHEHHSWKFLKPEFRKDKSGRSPTHNDYDARTLLVPDSFMKEQSPGMKQWMEFKCCNMDTILFFKVGKFYELYHMDADVGMSELDLIYMKGTKAHSGFPEVSYGKYANILVNRGYKVARVEQTETPEQMKERNDAMPRSQGKKDKVVRRELCSIMSKGTRTYCHLDEGIGDENNASQSLSTASPSSLLLCLTETLLQDDNEDMAGFIEYGVCIVDTVLGGVTMAGFQDDKQLTRLRTLLAAYCPQEILLMKNACCPATVGTLSIMAPSANVEDLQPAEVPCNPDAIIEALQKEEYFANQTAFPPILSSIVATEDSAVRDLMLRALGGVMVYLKRCCIDFEIFSASKFSAYIPPDLEASPALAPSSISYNSKELRSGFMILDAIALAKLEVLVNNFDHSERGSLWSFLNRCKTAFGRRRLRDWVCKPLLFPAAILERRNAIEELMQIQTEADTVRAGFKKLPDVERLLSRVHCNGLMKRYPAFTIGLIFFEFLYTHLLP